ncbi:MAG: transporter substrate-binding domain-containing protein [Cellvibrio sp.]|uniref:substrate-binding periplasmic protein n=1 Tax=Cellvibrio sp. TaxID=1965322 RepID=UPI002718D92E|nr:transporter substrate-binding domain-containing protein [Cellvibrio sp.]
MSRRIVRCVQRAALLLLFCCAGVAWATVSVASTVVIRQSNTADINTEDYYFYRVLELVLHKTEAQWGAAQIKQLPYRPEDKRLRSALMLGKVDVLWSPTSANFERQMLPVRISLLKELNNYRLLLIRKNEQPTFSAVQSIDDLRKLKGGMSSQWTDAKIMEYNKLPLVQAVGYGKLFKMLAAKRFDYFSRGVYQIHSEVNFYPELELQIEQELMLSYPNNVYFFVNQNNTDLAKRIEMGLKIAQRDGSFDKLFNSIPRFQWGLALLKKHQRRVITLQPLPSKTPAIIE